MVSSPICLIYRILLLLLMLLMRDNDAFIKIKLYPINTRLKNVPFEQFTTSIKTCKDHTTQLRLNKYRKKYGNRKSMWGDLDAHATRHLYHRILAMEMPNISQFYLDTQLHNDNLFTIASNAIDTRLAVREYARERSMVPVLLLSMLFEFFNKHSCQDKYHVWAKYATQLNIPIATHESDYKNYPTLCRLVIIKSSTTNRRIDELLDLQQTGSPDP